MSRRNWTRGPWPYRCPELHYSAAEEHDKRIERKRRWEHGLDVLTRVNRQIRKIKAQFGRV